ncbi:GTPase IMAP family member 4-like, partial [Scleropages formosus]|uniref:GTPase IMAP family member 4-like n=1 Tax=Scleropages formosus TaxID=113540 RepID=UPI0010FA991E
LVGPEAVGQSLVLDALLGCSSSSQLEGWTLGVSTRSVSWRAVVGGRQVTVVNTPDLLGSSLGVRERAWEALRSLQLASPGPHAFLLLMQIPAPGRRMDADAARTLRTLLNLIGEEALSYVLPVLTHTGSIKSSIVPSQLLEGLPGELEAMLSMCFHKPLVLSCGSQAKRRALGSELLEKVEEMSALGGYYRHQLHREEDSFREKLLEDMAAALELKLEKKEELSATRWH